MSEGLEKLPIKPKEVQAVETVKEEHVFSYVDLIDSLRNDRKISTTEKLKLAEVGYKILAKDFDEIKEKQEAEESALKESRESLGMIGGVPPSLSLKEHRYRLDDLDRQLMTVGRIRSELRKAVEKSPEQKSEAPDAGTTENISGFGARNISESIKKLTGALRKREGDRLNPLIEKGTLSRISGAAESFDSLAGRKDISGHEIEQAASALTSSLEGFGSIRQADSMREDPENLRRLKFAFGQIKDSIRGFSSQLTGKEGVEESKPALNRLDARIEKLYDFIGQKISLLNRYDRGR